MPAYRHNRMPPSLSAEAIRTTARLRDSDGRLLPPSGFMDRRIQSLLQGVRVVPVAEAERIADQALALQQRGRQSEARAGAGEKLGANSGTSKLVLDILFAR